MKWPISNADFYRINSGEIIEIKNRSKLDEEFYEYALKFKDSAHILTQYLLDDTDISKLDTYFFPVAYLYRHSIELILKTIGFKYIVNLEPRKAFVKETFHNLSLILETITPFIQSLIDKDNDAYTWLVSYFNDINAMDKQSDSFRYPFGISVEKKDLLFEVQKKYSIKLIFDEQTHINLVAFANKMEIAFELLDSLYQEKFGSCIYYKKYKPIFLEEGGGYYGQCVVGYKFSFKKFYPYVKAYTESGEYFHEKICENKSLKDTLFIPMCYLYRNAIELSLKETLFEECSFNFQEAIKHLNKKKHSILSLWNLIKDEIKEHANAPEDDITVTNVEKYINQLHNVDGSSDKFRYPTNKHLDLHFKRKKKFDIDNVNNFFGELASFLSAVNTMMSVHNEWKAEMEAEYRSDMASYCDISDYYD
ncbi:hypothetical protein [Phosphitispora sp. TUW77]|uniref:hypothetical protein n=1 Tax=Phosphitispora sp. TUW77 TaxID=3152361 RepID=UPI003AB685B6